MIIGTAGHIDHGKSALVEALTGAAMDPLAEERRRGITLDLHFAPLVLDGGIVAGVIDVPGHEDLIRTMVAGAAGLDLVLLIIAADEGIMPQTREHLAIVEQLRVPRGIPVITKRDLVAPDWLALVESEVSSWLARSPVPFTRPISTSAVRREGLDELRAAIIEQVAGSRRRSPNDLFRLPVDRALSLPGVGTVLTGTAWSGRLRIGDAVRLLPGGEEGRVRSLEHHGSAVEESTAGARTAVGVAGIDRGAVRRGHVLVRRNDPWQETSALDVTLDVLESAPRALVHHARIRLDLGTDEVLARVSLSLPIEPGRQGMARLTLERPIMARGGDRFVLRSYSPVGTVGGGWVLDPIPPKGRPTWSETLASEDPAVRLRALVERRATGLDLSLSPVLLGLPPEDIEVVVERSGLIRAGQFLVTPEAAKAASRQATLALAGYHKAHPAEAGMPLETLRQSLRRWGPAAELALDQLRLESRVVIDGGLIRDGAFRPAAKANVLLQDRLVQRLETAGLTPPTTGELESELGATGIPEALRAAAQAGRLEAVERDRFFSSKALATFTARVIQLGLNGPVTPQALRDVTGLSRKYLIPLLEYCDRRGITTREGDGRKLTSRARAGATGD